MTRTNRTRPSSITAPIAIQTHIEGTFFARRLGSGLTSPDNREPRIASLSLSIAFSNETGETLVVFEDGAEESSGFALGSTLFRLGSESPRLSGLRRVIEGVVECSPLETVSANADSAAGASATALRNALESLRFDGAPVCVNLGPTTDDPPIECAEAEKLLPPNPWSTSHCCKAPATSSID